MSLRRVLANVVIVPAVAFAGFSLFVTFLGLDNGRPSVCHGSVARGSLEGGRRPPRSGDNYHAYSTALFLAGRTFVHSVVRDVMQDSYAALFKDRPELRFVYGETGWPWGGRFLPHKTHSNGTSVDFFVPVRTLEGTISELSITPINQFGYGINFDRKARSGLHRIDFEAMGAHLLALDKAAHAHRIGIERVIFDVDLQPLLFASEHGAELRRRMAFNKVQAWVRHDQHYHVDFDVPCK